MSWIDYKKAYDMVPHSWIKEIFQLTGVANNICGLINDSMVKWGTLLSSNGDDLGKV